jgi:tetratricopeptide (TPR) repeat protein
MKWSFERRSRTAWFAAALLGLIVCPAGCPAPGQTPAPAEQPGQAAAAISPQFQPTPEQLADSLMAHQRYQAAIEQYRKVSPMGPDAWNKMGVAFQMMFDNRQAEQCYRKALKLEPKNAVALNNMGSIYMAQKEYSEAEKSYRRAVKLDPHTALFRKNLGTAYLAHRKYKKGWEAYQEALAIDPQIFDHANSVRVQNPSSVQDRGAMNFYMAKGCVKAGMPGKAVYYLRLALNEGFTTPKKIMSDAEFAVLYDNAEFQQMLAAQGVYLTKDSIHSPRNPEPVQP